MLPAMNYPPNAVGTRGWFIRPRNLTAISAILLAAFATMGFAGQYPVMSVDMQSASVERPCTQLETAADLLLSECGTLTLADVAKRKAAVESDDHDE